MTAAFATDGDLTLALEFRAALHAAMVANHDGSGDYSRLSAVSAAP